jgi:hypothetical protein
MSGWVPRPDDLGQALRNPGEPINDRRRAGQPLHGSAETRHFTPPSAQELVREGSKASDTVVDANVPDSGHTPRSSGVSPGGCETFGQNCAALKVRWVS